MYFNEKVFIFVLGLKVLYTINNITMKSLFAVFALSSCSKDEPKKNEPKQEELSFVGKTYGISQTRGLSTDYYQFKFLSATEVEFRDERRTPSKPNDKDPEWNELNVYKYTYTYDKVTRQAHFTKLVSSEESAKDWPNYHHTSADFTKVKFVFDEKFENLTMSGVEPADPKHNKPAKPYTQVIPLLK